MTKRRWFLPVAIVGGLVALALLVLVFIVLWRSVFPSGNPVDVFRAVYDTLSTTPPW